MPRYDFTCQDCGNVFEQVVPLPVPVDLKCPACQKSDLIKHFPCPAVHVFYSPMHPRHKRGMVGLHTPKVKPQFRPDAPFLKKAKKKGKKRGS
jgi:putative FmdB family regulatory protein